jgi:acetoin utilization deacetylase AcuC-like enzyme
MGFCLFNNLAIAVHDALQIGVEKVMIVDFDAHHGNGIRISLQTRKGHFYFHSSRTYIPWNRNV